MARLFISSYLGTFQLHLDYSSCGEEKKLNYIKNLESSKDSKHFCTVFVPGVALGKVSLGHCCPSAVSPDGFPVPICASHRIRAQPDAQHCV